MVDFEAHGVEPLHHAQLLVEVGVFGLVVLEAAAAGVESHVGQDVGQLIVEDVEDVLAVLAQDDVFALFLDRAQGLRAGVGGLGGQRVAQEELRELGVAEVGQPAVDVERAGLGRALHKVEARAVGVDVDLRGALLPGVLQQALAALVVGGVVGILAYRHSEYLGKLGPVAQVVVLVDDISRRHGQQPQVVGVAHQQQVVELVERGAGGVVLLAAYLAADGVDVLAAHHLACGPAVGVGVELEEREAPELGIEGVFDEVVEPRGADHLADALVGLPVGADEGYGRAGDVALALLDDGGQVSIEHHVGVDVEQAHAHGEVDVLGRGDGLLPVLDAHAPAVRLCDLDHGRGAEGAAALCDGFLLLLHS